MVRPHGCIKYTQKHCATQYKSAKFVRRSKIIVTKMHPNEIWHSVVSFIYGEEIPFMKHYDLQSKESSGPPLTSAKNATYLIIFEKPTALDVTPQPH